MRSNIVLVRGLCLLLLDANYRISQALLVLSLRRSCTRIWQSKGASLGSLSHPPLCDAGNAWVGARKAG